MTSTPGVISSPNHPDYYPHTLDKTEYVEVDPGKILRLEFTAFDVYLGGSLNTCTDDFVKITDGDGATLMEKTCGYYFFLPAAVTSTSNIVEIYFHTESSASFSGWRLTWRAVTPGA